MPIVLYCKECKEEITPENFWDKKHNEHHYKWGSKKKKSDFKQDI